MSAIAVVPVQSPQHFSAFLDLPKRIYADDPNWTTPLDIERRMHFDMKKNPFFAHAEGQLFLAFENGAPVGRISAHVDRLHLERYSDHTGNFGFLEAVDSAAVFASLLAAAEQWLFGGQPVLWAERFITREIGEKARSYNVTPLAGGRRKAGGRAA